LAGAVPALLCSPPRAEAAEGEIPRAVTREIEPKEVLILCLDGKDALAAGLAVRGTEGGARLRARRILERDAGAAAKLVAMLPALADLSDLRAALERERAIETIDDVLRGADTVLRMAEFARKGEFEGFKDEDIPYATVEAGLRALELLVATAPPGTVQLARESRCKNRLRNAVSYDDMRDISNSPICDLR